MKINECLVMMCVLKHEEIKYKKKTTTKDFIKSERESKKQTYYKRSNKFITISLLRFWVSNDFYF